MTRFGYARHELAGRLLARGGRRDVDVMVVSAGTTIGLRRAEDTLTAALAEAGASVVVVRSRYRAAKLVWRWIVRSLALIDLFETTALRRATTRALIRYRPRAIIYATTHAAMAQPRWRTRGAVAIRFDAPAASSRRGRTYALEHALEKRRFARARLLLPFGVDTSPEIRRLVPVRTRILPLPVPIDPVGPGLPTDERAPVAIAYAGNPGKKGLDILVEAWGLAAPPGHQLVVTGLDADAGRAWLARHGLQEPVGVRWAGRLDVASYRALTSTAELFLAASRHEDHGIAQLEALLDGALLVTVPSTGPYEALHLARRLQPGLVAERVTGPALADALRAAEHLDADARRRYRERASALASRYSTATLRERVRDELVPALLDR